MVTKYKLVNWEFNMGGWGRAMQESVDRFGVEFVAQILEVSPKTVDNWIKGYKSVYSEFPHPNMSNFIWACNQLDLDPREFFILEDVV
jgi:hypothetical protein